jgi:hypothetical protein
MDCKYKRLRPGQLVNLHLNPCFCPFCGLDFDYDGVFMFIGHRLRGYKIICTFNGSSSYRCTLCGANMNQFIEYCQDQHLFRFLTKSHILHIQRIKINER